MGKLRLMLDLKGCEEVNLKEAFILSCGEVFPMFGLTIEYVGESEEKSLNSAEQVNVLIGLTGGVKANVVMGFTRETAYKIISGMLCGAEVAEMGVMEKSALGELANILAGSSIGKLGSNVTIGLSPSTLALGEQIFLMASRAPAKKLHFKLGDNSLNIAFCIE